MTHDPEDPLKRWKLLPEARHHRVLFFVVVIAVLLLTLRLLTGII